MVNTWTKAVQSPLEDQGLNVKKGHIEQDLETLYNNIGTTHINKESNI